MDDIIIKIRQELELEANEETRQSGQRFFKEQAKLHGVKSAVVVLMAKNHFQEIKDRSKADIFQLCEELWQAGYLEETAIASAWAYSLRKQYAPGDFAAFEKWVQTYVNNWASCDTLCNHAVGAFIDMYPDHLAQLKIWAKSPNRWARRAAAVSLIIPARHGKFLQDIFEIADIMLLDADDMVQKGYGWMLKAASQAHQREVYEYVLARKAVMPRTALRYAIEKMPKELKAKAMAR